MINSNTNMYIPTVKLWKRRPHVRLHHHRVVVRVHIQEVHGINQHHMFLMELTVIEKYKYTIASIRSMRYVLVHK